MFIFSFLKGESIPSNFIAKIAVFFKKILVYWTFLTFSTIVCLQCYPPPNNEPRMLFKLPLRFKYSTRYEIGLGTVYFEFGSKTDLEFPFLYTLGFRIRKWRLQWCQSTKRKYFVPKLSQNMKNF